MLLHVVEDPREICSGGSMSRYILQPWNGSSTLEALEPTVTGLKPTGSLEIARSRVGNVVFWSDLTSYFTYQQGPQARVGLLIFGLLRCFLAQPNHFSASIGARCQGLASAYIDMFLSLEIFSYEDSIKFHWNHGIGEAGYRCQIYLF